MNYTLKLLSKKELGKIKILWEKLNEMHLKDSHYFKDHYQKFTFEERCEKFKKLNNKNIRIEAVDDNGILAGYCISTIEKHTGQLDSIFIEEKYRNLGLGGKLVENSIAWLKSNNCAKIMIAVATGHESVFGFYQKYNFYPRLTYLQMK